MDGLGASELTGGGLCERPLYFSNETESTTAGNGALGLPSMSRTAPWKWTTTPPCYIKAAGADAYDNYSDEYQAAVDAVADRLEEIAPVRAEARRESLIEDAQSQLDEARPRSSGRRPTPRPSWPKPKPS